jgi:8-oxo-dGTP pyrophosphatase MutT (NUDIX family)
LQALVREVLEETGYLVRPGRLIGVYSKPERDDLVLSIEAVIIGKNPWLPNSEIAECSFFFSPDELPRPMQRSTHMRLMDAFDRKFGVIREIAGKT